MSIKPIDKPLPGERVIALSPENNAEAATVWLARPNLFAGRALTHATLQRRQRWQAGRLALRGQAPTPGVVHGLEVGQEITLPRDSGTPQISLTIAAGVGLAASGEDVALARAHTVNLQRLPVFAEPSIETGPPSESSVKIEPDDARRIAATPAAATSIANDDEFGRDGAPQFLPARAVLKRNLGELYGANVNAASRVGVLVLQPIQVDRLGEFDPTDPCELSQCGEAGDNLSFEDVLIADGVRVVWYPWPTEWQALPEEGATFRNELAWTIFAAEAALGSGAVLPWEELGVPIALIALDEELMPLFIDRNSVVRRGGDVRDPRLVLEPGRTAVHWRRSPLWQAQIEQLAEQIADTGDPVPPVGTLTLGFTQLPPAGLLPTNAIDLTVLPLNRKTEALRSDFFPGQFELDAVPVPIENLDLAIREAAPLGPIDMKQPDRVRVLVPVPQAVFEPRLLLEEEIDPEFQATLDRFLLARARALGAREGLRNKISELVRYLTGRAIPVPPIKDDPLALEAEGFDQPGGVPPSGAGWGPPPGSGGHRASSARGRHQHAFENASGAARMTVVAGDLLYAWAHLDPDDPPRVLMFQWRDSTGSWEHRAYWSAIDDGALIDLGSNDTVSRRRVGDLPTTGRWVRLEVEASAVGIAGPVNGMAFTFHDGRAAFGPAGRLAGGVENQWFSNALPQGAEPLPPDDVVQPWAFLTPNDLYAPFEPRFGLEPNPPTNAPFGVYAAIEALENDAALAPVQFDTSGDYAGGVLSEKEIGKLTALGIDGFISFLKSRADRADDFIDFGFVKVQTDTYRVRQLILGTTDATRLAISPALATIAQAETAVASQERISTFFDELRSAPRAFTATAEPPSGGAPPAATAAAMVVPPAAPPPTAMAMHAVTSVASAPSAASAAMGSFGSSVSFKLSESTMMKAGGSGGGGFSFDTGILNTTPMIVAQPAPSFTAETRLLQKTPMFFTPNDVTNVDPLIGKAQIRTTTIAERLKAPKAVEAKDYATSTRHDAVQALLRLATELSNEDGATPGLFAGINLYALVSIDMKDKNNPKPKDPILTIPGVKDGRYVPLSAFINVKTQTAPFTIKSEHVVKLLQMPDAESDEAEHFSDSADMSDNTVALLRQVEGRVKLYRNAIVACERVRDVLRKDIAGAEASRAAWDERLAEARHDVGVTRALIAEENARIAAINARRAEVLRNNVRFLAYIRPRETRNLLAAPVRNLDPGLIEPPVPACLAAHADVPDELNAMLAVVREAPAAWFTAVPQLVESLDRVDLLVRTVQAAQVRSQAFALKPQPATVAMNASLAAKAINLVQARQHQAIIETRQVAAAVNVAQFAALPWRGAVERAQAVLSLGDLIDGEHGRGEVSRRAAVVYDQMSHVAACLHAEFSAVLPSIRLDWAERLSQFDAAPRLRDLSVLPRWPEIEFIDRKQMQAYVDWLFGQINAREPRADGLMNDVVRMCLLLAADAPIGRILAGRLPRPVIARPGVQIPLTALDPAKLRVGMHALIYGGSEVLVRAVVEDIGSEVSARVLHTATPEVKLGLDVRVQFSETAQISLARLPAKRAIVR